MSKIKSSDVFNYDFGWYQPKKTKLKSDFKEVCCKKYKKKGEKQCKNCPKLAS